MSVRFSRRALSGALSTLAVLALVPICAAASAPRLSATAAPRLSATAAVLWSPKTGQTLYGLNASRSQPIASATKLMTSLIVLEHARLGETFTEPRYYPSAVDSQIGLVPGERMSVHDLMLALLLPSADDAAENLAFNVGHGSVSRFVAMMNAKARELGLTHTHYSTPIGLDTAGNYSSASDLVRLAAFLLDEQPFFRRAVALPSAVVRMGGRRVTIVNRNDLVGHDGINGVKTGHTSEAGYVLVASTRRDGMTLLSAVLGTSSEYERDANTLRLLDYGFAEFATRTPIRAGQVLARPTVRDRPGAHATVIAARTITRVFRRSDKLSVRVDAPRQLAGPLRRGAVVGSVVVMSGERVLARVPLWLAQALPDVSPLTVASHFVTRTSTLLSLFALLAVAVALVVIRRRMRSRQAGEEEAEWSLS